MNKILLAALVVVVVIALGVFFLGNDGTDTEIPSISVPNQQEQATTTNDQATTPNNGGDSTNTPVTPSNQLVLAENEGGNIVTIAYAQLTEPGYVALFRMNSQSDVALIGSSDLLQPGEYTNLTIQLSSVAVEGQNMAGVLYSDDGDEEFTYTEGDVYLTNGTTFVSDVDVIGVDPEDEAEELSRQIDNYLEANN
jgi:hypothetical protein